MQEFGPIERFFRSRLFTWIQVFGVIVIGIAYASIRFDLSSSMSGVNRSYGGISFDVLNKSQLEVRNLLGSPSSIEELQQPMQLHTWDYGPVQIEVLFRDDLSTQATYFSGSSLTVDALKQEITEKVGTPRHWNQMHLNLGDEKILGMINKYRKFSVLFYPDRMVMLNTLLPAADP